MSWQDEKYEEQIKVWTKMLQCISTPIHLVRVYVRARVWRVRVRPCVRVCARVAFSTSAEESYGDIEIYLLLA